MNIFRVLTAFFLLCNTAIGASFDVEDPHICKHTLAKYKQPIAQQNSALDGLINAVLLHCQDQHQASIEALSPVLSKPADLSSKQLTYAYILQSVNLNNIADDNSCAAAKLSMAHGMNSNSELLSIRAELNYFSFCNVYDDNTQHALKRLYELNQIAADMDSLNLQLVIHNQLSFVYYMLEQNQLSAEEAEKALALSEQLAADDYLLTLFNLIDAYLDAKELSLAEQRLALYEERLASSQSEFEHYLFHYAKSYLAYLQADYRKVLTVQSQYFEKTDFSSPSFDEKLAILKGLSCWQLAQYECMEQTIKQHFSQYIANDGEQAISRLGLYELLIHWHTYQQDHRSLNKAQQGYFNLANDKLTRQQQAAKVLGVAKLNNEVIRLNSEGVHKQLVAQNQTLQNYRVLIGVIGALLVLVTLAYLHLRRRVSQQVLRINELK
ncbi:hypothetical protein [Thalassotalea euphylliae]|uniref:GGDEF domain-containing protein n=1 Tax=Thalassotalea euphylliae TaxID=1655234 RepID=A0A3E0UIC9_9GAMM|nr:hypothetical protein [Thalassotalea euphylliae]REL36626.1 hypothetical protein DXX92_15605 [Thalassotalea euphylliae]